MKKTYLIPLIAGFLIVALGFSFFFFSISGKEINQESIAQQQEVIKSIETDISEEREYISPEKQKQLDQITGVYSDSERAYRDSVTKTMLKYNSNFTQSDSEKMLSLIEASQYEESLISSIKAQFNMSFLKTDISAMMEGYKQLVEEKDLELSRLEAFGEKNNSEIDTNTQTLIELSISESLRQNSTLSSRDISILARDVAQNIFKTDSYIFSGDTYESQIGMIQDELSAKFQNIKSLSSTEKLKLIKIIRDDITDLEILSVPVENNQPDEISDESTSFFPPKNGLKYLSSFMFPSAYADESVSLSSEERQILILKTQIFIDRILQESIETEIEYNAGNITQINYENIIENNLIELEELVILKDSLENDPDAITLGDIQRFNLGAYVDDSEMIQDLSVLAYIQSKSGHIIVNNLNGSARLGEENMSLYSGYSIETLSDSHVTLIFSDESILRLNPLSRVTISNPSAGNINVGVERGALWSRVLKPLLSGDTFSIEVDGVSLGVRGTSLSVSKLAGNTNINIVDSFTSDGSASVEIRDGAGTTSQVMPGKQISIDASGNASVSDKSRENLLSENPDIGNFIRDDLAYLSLLINDRKRGFYNTPIISKNDGENFLNKLVGELEVSIPQGSETPYIIKNSELSGELVNTGSIYHLIKKDAIISALKDNPSGASSAKIAAVRNLDMVELEAELGNKRAIEDLFNYNILKDITDETTFTTGQLKDIFTGFPIEETQDKAKLLASAKKELSINGGSSIVTGDITLDTEIGGVDITWKSSLTDIISDTGRAPPRVDEASTILTATLTIGNLSATKDFGLTVVPREATPLDELESAAIVLDKYINITMSRLFDDSILEFDADGNITYPDFGANGGIIPIVKFTGSQYVSDKGYITNPSYIPSEINGFVTDLKQGIDLQIIPLDQRESIVSADISDLVENQDRMQVIISATLTHQLTGETYTPDSYTIQIKKRDPKDQILAEIQDIEYCALKLGDNDCYELVAEAEYDVAGDYNLKLNDDILVTADVGSGVNNNSYNLQSYYGGNIEELSRQRSFVRYGGEKGILLENYNGPGGGPEYLSYDLTQLPENLGDDWAIEMSVHGEDILGEQKGLLNITPTSNISQSKLYLYYAADKIKTHTASNNEFKDILVNDTNYNTDNYNTIALTSGNVFINDTNYINNLPMSLNNSTLFVGSHRNKIQQWNGIINFIKIYKIKE